MSPSEKPTEILNRFLDYAARSAYQPLGFLDSDPGLYEGPPDSADVLKSLTAKFSIEDLTESGVVRREEDGPLGLAPSLGPGQLFLVLRDEETGEPYNLLTAAGCLKAKSLPVLEILRDAHTQAQLEECEDKLFVAFDLETVLLLRACGLAATMAMGLDDLPLDQLERFSEVFGVPSDLFRKKMETDNDGEDSFASSLGSPLAFGPPRTIPKGAGGMPTAEHEEPLELFFVGWTPGKLSASPPAPLKAIADHLHQLAHCLDFGFDQFGLWQVSEREIDQLQFLAERRHAGYFREALLRTTADIQAGLMWFGKTPPPQLLPPSDYPTAVARYYETLGQKATPGAAALGPDQKQSAWRSVQKVLEQQIIQPLREHALASADPLERVRLLAAADISQIFHLESLKLTGDLLRGAARPGPAADRLPDQRIKDVVALADRVLPFTKDSQRCPKPQPLFIEVTPRTSPTTPRLPG